jgi:endoplasmic reticulum junction formation protein lunapark
VHSSGILCLEHQFLHRILFTRRIVQLWYTRIGDAEGTFPVTVIITNLHFESLEKTLKTLLRQQRTKIEEIKKKTNYYTTRNLLERYDESPSAAGGGADPNSVFRRRMPGGPPTTPQRQGQPPSANPQPPASKVQIQTQTQPTPISSSLQIHLAGTTVSRRCLSFQLY